MTVYESYHRIPYFPNYMISSFGRVYNLAKNTFMTHTPTLGGDLTVGLNINGSQYRRSVKRLVAEAFVQGKSDLFDTPIQLDNDKTNLHASNIVWRPRWFAWKYARQLDAIPSWAWSGPVVDIVSGVEFENIIEAAVQSGSLILDIRWSLLHKKEVFPHNMVFAYKY